MKRPGTGRQTKGSERKKPREGQEKKNWKWDEGKRGKTTDEGGDVIWNSLQSVKGQQPTLWFHLASSLSVCVCAFACGYVLYEWKSARAKNWPLYGFVYVNARLHTCVFVCSCQIICVYLQVHTCMSKGARMCVCACARTSPRHSVSLPDIQPYRDWKKSTGTHLWHWLCMTLMRHVMTTTFWVLLLKILLISVHEYVV